MRNRIVLVVAVTAVLLAGCGDNDSASETPGASLAGSSVPAAPDPPRDDSPDPGDDSPKQSTASSDAALTVTDIQLERGPGSDRVVYHLGGNGTPGWIVRYTDHAAQDGSGNPVDVSGRSILEVRILGSTYPFDSGVAPYTGPDPVHDPEVPGIAGVYGSTVFEGATQSFVGIQADHPAFTVRTMADPTRLVVDITRP
ncbi:hypothetical protein ACL02S_07830 [Nocardia sp. 004]|uniref:AMIN-like domain-containing (lipo)protein n=1 Tax=Nocardia sp. 004 TaxID=3385978 RepID=UPI0039A290C0